MIVCLFVFTGINIWRLCQLPGSRHSVASRACKTYPFFRRVRLGLQWQPYPKRKINYRPDSLQITVCQLMCWRSQLERMVVLVCVLCMCVCRGSFGCHRWLLVFLSLLNLLRKQPCSLYQVSLKSFFSMLSKMHQLFSRVSTCLLS